MIVLGADEAQKRAIVAQRAQGKRVFYCGPAVAPGDSAGDRIRYDDATKYVHFYRWLQEIGPGSVLVLDEPMHDTERSSLPLNCLRHYTGKAPETIVFSYLPMVEDREDFMILFDLATKSRWRQSKLDDAPLHETQIVSLGPRRIHFSARELPVDEQTASRVAACKRKLIDGIGSTDPHTIPRRLYQETGMVRFAAVTGTDTPLVGRNNRFKLTHLMSFREADARPRTVFELCHEHAVFNSWLARTRQEDVEVLVADARVDRWYFDRYVAWSGRLTATCDQVTA